MTIHQVLRIGSVLPLAVAALAISAGCDNPGLTPKAKSPAAVRAPVGTGTTNAATLGQNGEFPGAAQTPTVFTHGLSLSDAIADACGIPPRPEGKKAAPNFDFDSYELGEDDRDLLGKVAKCLTEGGLKGRAVALIGRADPRGEHEYNMTLGGNRSASVETYLHSLGVPRDRMKPTSRGELDATGKDEAGWAEDRRVDLELLP